MVVVVVVVVVVLLLVVVVGMVVGVGPGGLDEVVGAPCREGAQVVCRRLHLPNKNRYFFVWGVIVREGYEMQLCSV